MLINKINDYLKINNIKNLSNQSWIWENVFLSILNKENRKYNKNTLDILYSFFWLSRDDFYLNNLKKRNPKTNCLFGYFIRLKRLKKNINILELAKKIKMGDRAIARIEAGDSLPSFNSYTIENLSNFLEFNNNEKKIIKKYIEITKELNNLLENEIKDIEKKTKNINN